METTGECRCGRVKMELTAEPLLTFQCHCDGCQKMMASAFSLTAKVPAAGFKVVAGDPVLGGLQTGPAHYYCPHCKSCLFSKLPGQEDVVNVRMTLFEGLRSYPPFIEVYLSERLPWIQPSAPRQYERAPTPDELSGLLQDYAAWRLIIVSQQSA